MRSPEMVSLVDDAGNRIGQADKSEVHGPDTPRHLAFSCYLFDAAGNLLVTRRALAKLTWAGVWTNSCCGHPTPAEPVADAVRRRVGEELDLDVERLRLRLPDFSYRATDVTGIVENEFCPVFTATVSRDPAPDPAEVGDWRWVPWRQFVRVAESAPWALSPWSAEQAVLLGRIMATDLQSPGVVDIHQRSRT